MVTYYITALAPAKGAEGDLQKFQAGSAKKCAWYSPLPLIIPIHTFEASFPRDRVNPSGLKGMPPLILAGPVRENENIILKLKEAEGFNHHQTYLREIHGKQIPRVSDKTFIDWQGLLLNPGKLSFADSVAPENTESVQFNFRNWQIGLYKIRYDETRLWWENFRCSCLWQVRKPAS
ncbi:hypothetical protein [Oceanispirochaeta sp.]|jgi:hypothetical protein|uniref:hypothetical protein n=1 Tax=Oceanispirochaeta sp. TaxID=2035350 RepID=UPI002612E538|nr:hypothetical protein [Oceanispirochaeta sp.]MDA3957009.1 hypothetical protein [Oceanispirochaeta sp.]